MDKATKQAIIKDFARSEGDVGSCEVQIAILTGRVKELTEHLKANKKDHGTRRGLIRMVNNRRKHLRYLKSKDLSRYLEVIKRLGLRR